MEHVITENLIVDVENEDEEFALVECPLSPEEGPQDYYSYYAYDKEYRLNSGQRIIRLWVRSLQEYLETLAHLVKNGWTHDIIIKQDQNNWNSWNSLVKTSMFYKKLDNGKCIFTYEDRVNLLSLKYIKSKAKETDMEFLVATIPIDIRVDFKKLEKFRSDLKSMQGYKIRWRKQDIPKHYEPMVDIIK